LVALTPSLPALAVTAPEAGILGALLAAAAMLAVPRERVRAAMALLALIGAPAALVAQMSGSALLTRLTAQPLKLAVAGAVGLAAMAALAWLFSKRPKLFPYLVAAALPFRVPLEFGGETANLLVPLYLVVGAGTLKWIASALRGRTTESEHQPGAVDLALAGWLVVFAIASLWSDDPEKAVQDAVFFYVPFALMFALLRQIEWTAEIVRGCALVLAALALIFSGVAFYEYFTETLLLNPKLLISNQFHTYFRVNSVFFDPNIFGRFLMLVMIGLAAVILDSKNGRTVAIATGVSAVLLAAMVMTLSQSSLLGLLAGFATLAALRWSARVVTVVAVLAAGAAIAAVVVLPAGGKIASLKSLNNQSSGRASLVRGGVDLFTARPVTGWGSGSFSVAYKREQRAGAPSAVTASHTTPVTVAAEQGVIGFAAYIALLFFGLRTALRRARLSTARAAVSAGLVALVFHTLTYAAFFEDPALWALLALAVALPLPLTREERRSERESRRAAASEPGASGAAAPV